MCWRKVKDYQEHVSWKFICSSSRKEAPFSKTGGLGGRYRALPKYHLVHDRAGSRAESFCRTADMTDAKFGDQLKNSLLLWSRCRLAIKEYVGVKIVLESVNFYFIDNQHYFFIGHVYGDFDSRLFCLLPISSLIELMERVTIPRCSPCTTSCGHDSPGSQGKITAGFRHITNIRRCWPFTTEFQGLRTACSRNSLVLLWTLCGTLRWNDCQ